ncbi:putative hsp40 co-chaperone protein [Zalerion maritima]|uniref:Hsp40 co-chaperone protein n=1 Tax=Zalerion maritima TaxID=339359 RepID=A0AAD5RNM8_9PEZI|nr:putative hsp40 co-chaperone protein [Zalerion maritima]
MLLKQSAITVCSSSARSGINPPCPTPFLPAPDCQHREKRNYHKQQRGHDKHPRSRSPISFHTNHWPACRHPTPYEIFDIHRTAPYSKTRFYELVKLYHPDRHSHTAHHALPHVTKLERYRLIVLAHSILSDPDRRQKYDQFGAGWGGRSDMQSPRCHYPDGKSWRDQPGSAANNATWEDWERWHQERDSSSKNDPLYMSNGLFAAFVVVVTFMGAVGHYSWVDTHARKIAYLQDEHNREIAQDLKNQQLNGGFSEGEARIQAYVRRKEGSYYVPPSFR